MNIYVQMYGQYTRELSKFARQEAERNGRSKTAANHNEYHADNSTSSLHTEYSTNKSCR